MGQNSTPRTPKDTETLPCQGAYHLANVASSNVVEAPLEKHEAPSLHEKKGQHEEVWRQSQKYVKEIIVASSVNYRAKCNSEEHLRDLQVSELMAKHAYDSVSSSAIIVANHR